MTEVDKNFFEIEMAKKTIRLDMPHQLGYWILSNAKKRMLEFYFDCIDRFVDRSLFEYVEMDTDSAYMALATHSLEDAVRPELKRDFFTDWPKWFPAESCSEHHPAWIECKMRGERWIDDCEECRSRRKTDKRHPGLFKLEYTGSEMLALCSKTYFADGEQGSKFSSKGIQKRAVKDAAGIMTKVLETKQSASATNIGFRARDNTMFTYTQERAGFSYFYCKRKLQPDGIHTEPLDLVLTPPLKRQQEPGEIV